MLFLENIERFGHMITLAKKADDERNDTRNRQGTYSEHQGEKENFLLFVFCFLLLLLLFLSFSFFLFIFTNSSNNGQDGVFMVGNSD